MITDRDKLIKSCFSLRRRVCEIKNPNAAKKAIAIATTQNGVSPATTNSLKDAGLLTNRVGTDDAKVGDAKVGDEVGDKVGDEVGDEFGDAKVGDG